MNKTVFVFVVCGAAEHINTLHFSLRYLRKYARSEIYVVTDTARNEVAIQHTHQIDIRTPETYTNHQASIYLKTGLHLFLPTGNFYCYLDTDVIALSEQVEQIFNQFVAPIQFAPDHCSLKMFSSSAINCGCEVEREQNTSLFLAVNDAIQKHQNDPSLIAKRQQLELMFNDINKSHVKKVVNQVKFKFSPRFFRLNDDFYFDKMNGVWNDRNHVAVLYESYHREIEKATQFTYDSVANHWLDKNGIDIWSQGCNHLVEAIYETFGISVSDTDWQHWNGGVFLFNDCSRRFLDAWHSKCKKIFNEQNWKTRDQGTLIATVWEFGLQNHPTLDKKWNFLADKNNKKVDFKEDGLFTDNSWETNYRVNFIHVYHNFGDTSWDLWNYILKKQ